MSLENIETFISSIDADKPDVQLDPCVEFTTVLDFLNEHAKEPKRIECLLSKYQEDVRKAKEKLSQTEKQRSNLRKEVSKINDETVSLDKQINKIKGEIRDSTFLINKAKTLSGISEKEHQIMEQHETELKAYKSMTGIRFNIDVPDDKIEGLITNSHTLFVKPIMLDKSIPMKKIREELWSTIKEAGTKISKNIEENKEN